MRKHSMKYLFLLILVFSLIFSSIVWAESKIRVEIDLRGESKQYSSLDIKDKSFNIWKLPNDKDDYDWEKLIEDLNKLSDDELKNKYEEPEQIKSNGEGLISLELDNDLYYIREVESNSTIHFQPFLLLVNPESVNSDGIIKVFPKPISYETKLVKTSPDGKKLAGAEFELHAWDDEAKEWKKVPLADGRYSENASTDYVLITDEIGEIRLSDLPAGRYRFKEIKAPNGYLIENEFSEFVIKANSAETTVVEVVNHRSVHNFLKTDEGNTPLKGAKFLVTKKLEDGYEKIQVNGSDYVISSREDGYFLVENLPYGEYVLWEAQPPYGFAANSEGIPFVMDENSYNKLITIKNRRIPIVPPDTPPDIPPEIPPEIPPNIPPEIPNIPEIPKVPLTEQGISPKVPKPNSGIEVNIPPKKPLIVVPKTGDITLFLMIGGGIILAGLGYSMVREKDSKTSA